MELNKYKKLMFQKIKDQMKDWFENPLDDEITNEEVYRFLHSIKGTSGTLQLVGLFQLSTKLLDQIKEQNDKIWHKAELRDFLYELITLSFEYENFYGDVEHQFMMRSENVPLVQIIDDDISMLILLKDVLESQGYMVIASTNPEKAIQQYYDMNPDCLILDLQLPNKNGFQILEDVQQHNFKKFIPKVMISIQKDRDTRLMAFKMGADDFINKPIDLEEFLVRVSRQLQRKQIFDQSVMIDELTGIYNRKFLEDSIQRNLNDLKRSNIHFSIAVLDLDFFKKVNDTYGHLTGDKVLVEFARFLKENIRVTDTVFRFGGEEFIVLFPRTNDTDAKEVLERLLNKFSNIVFEENGDKFSITFSAGVFMVVDGETPFKTVIKIADQALYVAKENGRARVESANSLKFGLSRKVLHVSVVDDDSIIRTMLSKILQSMELDRFDLDIQVYVDGKHFLDSKRSEEKGQHFIILDGMMPVVDGLEVLKYVKTSPNASQINVLMLTARKNEEDIARALMLGADDYVTKPFSITELQARIQRLIQRMK